VVAGLAGRCVAATGVALRSGARGRASVRGRRGKEVWARPLWRRARAPSGGARAGDLV